MATLTLAQASVILETALKTARDKNFQPLSVALLDAGGHLVAFKREDKSGILRFDIAFGKAWGALGIGSRLAHVVRTRREDPDVLHDIGGGERRPRRDQSRRCADPRCRWRRSRRGGISGDTSDNDELCAISGIAAAGLKADRVEQERSRRSTPSP